MAAGWNGSRAILDVKERVRREKNAYKVEINLAESLGRKDIADELRANLADEIKTIKERDEMYARNYKNT